MKKSHTERMCTSKRRYIRKGEARNQAKFLRKRTKLMYTIYRCPVCHAYHITKGEVKHVQFRRREGDGDE